MAEIAAARDGSQARASERASPGPAGADRRLLIVLAVSCGAAVANLYYLQPLLSTIAHAFRVSDGSSALLVTDTQLCYVAGLVLIAPLGDVIGNRRLAVVLTAICSVGLAVASVSPALVVLAAALGVVAIASAVVQVLIPLASTLPSPAVRGQTVGIVLTGGLTGILLARTVAGALASLAGWRAPFATAAVLMGVLSVALWRTLPHLAARSSLRYRRLLVSTFCLMRSEPLLRHRMALGACGFASFTLVWTGLAYVLAGRPFHYGPSTIGLFGLAGSLGAIGARGFGRLSDRGLTRPATGAVLLICLCSWGVLALGAASVVLLALGLVALDFGIQGQNVLSISAIYALGAGNAGRVSMAYTTANFAGGAVGSIIASATWATAGWDGICIAGSIASVLAIGVWLYGGARHDPGGVGAGSRSVDPPPDS